jgi:Ppx/GppA phosphatase family
LSKPVRIAAIDIGSDTVHILIADVSASPDGPLVSRVKQRGDLIELGRQVGTTGQIGKRAAARLEARLTSYLKLARRRSDRVVIGATEALRRASDGPALLERLSSELGEPVRILSVTREASTELTLTDGHVGVASASLPVGAALLGERGPLPRRKHIPERSSICHATQTHLADRVGRWVGGRRLCGSWRPGVSPAGLGQVGTRGFQAEITS